MIMISPAAFDKAFKEHDAKITRRQNNPVVPEWGQYFIGDDLFLEQRNDGINRPTYHVSEKFKELVGA